MNYKEARVYLDEVSKYGSVLGLESMRELLRRLGDPQNELKFIHISGTNGKGSVLAYLSTILSGAGYRTGRYISPTLFSYRERIQVDGEYIEKESLACHVTAIAAAAEDMQKAGLPSPTVFEIETALAFLYFKEKRCDIVTLEVGCGGLLDATNVITTTLMEVIASISMDHTDLLGDTLAKIAAQKAGIIKPDTMVVSAQQKSEAAQVIEDTCKEQHCTLQMVDESKISNVHYGAEGQTFSYKTWENVAISLAGSYQIKNAALALEGVEALRKLGYALSDQQVREGLLHTAWRGRFTTLRRDPTVIIDGAHNPAAALELKESLERYFPGKMLYFVMGMFKDKDYAQVIDLTAPLARHIITVETTGNPRAMPARELAEAVGKVNPSVEWADSVAHGVEKALAMAGKEDAVIVFGSLSFLGEAADAVNEK
ncbi:MAG: bifunctional folylpolyglutamate synthase/dihydrofolate synthase [Oscillibacter sp.]|nr:bifunctional folylpolyglutamate synthase/dihydrofolate synthase [Oscillibacter sp.]